MNVVDQTTLPAVFLIFCRIGACLAIAPGLSTPRINMRFRLLAALGVTLALAPALLDKTRPAAMEASEPTAFATLIFGEFFIGATLGLMTRILLAALETLAVAASMSVGMSSIFAPRVEENDTLPDLAAFVSLAATTLFFVTNQHYEVLRVLADSYSPYPAGAYLSFGRALERLTEALSAGFLLALRLMSPFIMFGLSANFAFALLNRLVPQIAIYFVATPFVLLGGLLVAYGVIDRVVPAFVEALSAFIARG